MHFSILTFTALTALFTTTLAHPSEHARRSCSSVGCYAEAGSVSGEYCGYCGQVDGNWVADDIYQLNSDGACCDYGYSDKCAAGAEEQNYAYCPI
jgi:hypothetical protein